MKGNAYFLNAHLSIILKMLQAVLQTAS